MQKDKRVYRVLQSAVWLAVFGAVAVCQIPAWADDPAVTAEMPAEAEKKLTLAVINLTGQIMEGSTASIFSLSGVTSTNLMDMVKRLELAGEDEAISGVLFNIEEPMFNWAQVDELRQAVAALRQKGKKTYAYLEEAGQDSYLFACSCDQIAMTPSGNLMLAGLAGETLYFKNLLDKLGIQADMIQIGDYKSAGETMTRSGPSPQEMQQFNQLFDNLYGHMVQSIAESRKMTDEQVRRLIDEGPYTTEQAQAAGLIDQVLYREEFLKKITEQEDTKISLKTDYGQAPRPAINPDDPFAMLSVLQGLFKTPPEPTGDAIAVVYINGPITSGENMETFDGSVIGSRTIRLTLAKARADKNIKGVVVRIDSPGGSATASDIMYNAILQTAREKPVVVSMGGVAASGGYYAACGANTILAQPSTITGSIGVIGGKIVIGGLLGKLGITSYTFHRGRNAALFSSMQPFTVGEHLNIKENMELTYERFKQCVRQSRGAKLTDSIDYLAQGKIYTGLQAKQAGLIDEIGTLEDAIGRVAEQAGIETYQIRIMPSPKSLVEVLTELLARSDAKPDEPLAALGLSPAGGENPLWLGRSAGLKSFLIQKILHHVSSLIYLFQQEHTLLVLPYEVIMPPFN